jgi:hypothetical protein
MSWIRTTDFGTDPGPDLDPDSGIFVIDLQDTNKKIILKKFICCLLSGGTFSSFF